MFGEHSGIVHNTAERAERGRSTVHIRGIIICSLVTLLEQDLWTLTAVDVNRKLTGIRR